MAESSETNGSFSLNELIPKGLSKHDTEVYEELIGVAPDKPRPIVVIMDLGQYYYDLAVLVVLKELQRLGFVELRAVVVTKIQCSDNLEPAYYNELIGARLAKLALNSLDLPDVLVANGWVRDPDLPVSPVDEWCNVKDRVLAMSKLMEYIEGDCIMAEYFPLRPGGQDLLLEVYTNAKEKGEKLHLLCLPSLQDVHDFSRSYSELVAGWTAEVHAVVPGYTAEDHVGGAVSNTSGKGEGVLESPDSFLLGDMNTLMGERVSESPNSVLPRDRDTLREWHSFTQGHAIPSRYYTASEKMVRPSNWTDGMAWKETSDELQLTGHPLREFLGRLPLGDQMALMLRNVHAAIAVAGPDVLSKLEVLGSKELQGDHHWIIVTDLARGKLWQAMSSLLKGSLLDAVEKTLCDFCKSINFGAVGYRKQKVEEFILIDNGRTHRPIREVLQNVMCVFCVNVAKSFRVWSLGKFDMHALDCQNDSNQAQYEMVRLHGKHEDSSDYTIIRIQVALKVFSYERVAHSLILEFQKFNHPVQQVQAYHGRIRPLCANISLFWGWIKDCCNGLEPHPHCGKSTGTDEMGQFKVDQTGEFMGLDGLRLIDVNNMCVVDVQGDVSYTALSYIWGEYKLGHHQKIMPKLTIENRFHFQQAGSLLRVVLPKTIADAIVVTRRLGFKYIWIDCLCIVQGDEIDERYFISQMDVIFGCAAFTIVAAAGDDADAGLPGISHNSRTREQVPFMVRGVSLVRTLDPEQSEERHSSFDGYLKESQWCKRGWTFQEKLLSPRALIFTEEQVYWECQTSSRCEDGWWEDSHAKIYRHCFGDKDYCLPWEEGFERRYRKMVKEYSGRKFKYEKDRRDAFEGILQRFQWHAKRRQLFLWALPKRFLSNALTWHCQEISPQRRVEKCRVTSEWGQPIKDCPFPSWCWFGWAGKVCFNGTLDGRTVDLVFYYFFGGKLLSAKQADATLSLSDMLVRNDDDETIVTLENIPKSLDHVLVQEADQSNILFFWSSIAILHVRHDGVDSDGSAKLIVSHGVDSKGKLNDIGVKSWLHKPSFPSGHAERVEFVVIGMIAESDTRFLAVLLVEWKNGVAYRQGLVHIQLSIWVALKREWKLIFLG